jgi:hypothetical protein
MVKKKKKPRWTRGDKLALAGNLIGVATLIAAILALLRM